VILGWIYVNYGMGGMDGFGDFVIADGFMKYMHIIYIDSLILRFLLSFHELNAFEG